MSPAIWADSTFNGPGPRARQRERPYRCERSQSAKDRHKVLQCIEAILRGAGLVSDNPVARDLSGDSYSIVFALPEGMPEVPADSFPGVLFYSDATPVFPRKSRQINTDFLKARCLAPDSYGLGTNRLK
jgi:hypothetical protein